MNRPVLAALLLTTALITPAHADTPAPPGTSTAVAADVAGLVTIGDTGAQHGSNGGSASASAVEVGGQPLLGLGGTQEGEGRDEGALLDTGDTALGRVAVAPWEAEVTEDESHGRAAALDLYLLDEDTVAVTVLEAESEAHGDEDASSGSAASDGAHVTALDGTVDLTVLHSESGTDNSSTHLVGLNDTEVGTDEQLGATCSLDVVVAAVGCLAVQGGNGSSGGAVVVVDKPVDGVVSGTTGSGGSAKPREDTSDPDDEQKHDGASKPGDSDDEDQDLPGALAFTGSPVLMLLVVGVGLVLLGVGVGQVLRRKARVAR